MTRPANRSAVCTVLDGPVGTELAARGVDTPLPGWSAHALEAAPEVVLAIHRDYVASGARVLTANTFRTQPGVFPDRWRELTRSAVELGRRALAPGVRLAGSIAPLADCYRPDLSPADRDPAGTERAHALLAERLAELGCDLLLCETFPHALEARLAVRAAAATGVETWLALTPGPEADLLTPAELARAAEAGVAAGARAVLVNCAPARAVLGYLRELAARLGGRVPLGAYANAGRVDERMGWSSPAADPGAAERYAALAEHWQAAGASLLGGCCGTGPAHVAALARRFGAAQDAGS